MNDQGSVNSQIVDSVSDVTTLASGLAPTQAFGMLDTVMTETLGMAMYNAVSRQQGASMIGSAATTAVCAKMLSTPFPFEIPPPRPPVPPSPHGGGVKPLRPVNPPSPSDIVADAAAAADEAVDLLWQEADDSDSTAHAARAELAAIVERAGTDPHPTKPAVTAGSHTGGVRARPMSPKRKT
jgi:Killing trait